MWRFLKQGILKKTAIFDVRKLLVFIEGGISPEKGNPVQRIFRSTDRSNSMDSDASN
jgi:hypothetical protein